jgi:hypothetical protein
MELDQCQVKWFGLVLAVLNVPGVLPENSLTFYTSPMIIYRYGINIHIY